MLNRFLLVFVLFFSLPALAPAQQQDSLSVLKDSTHLTDTSKVADTLQPVANKNIIDSSIARAITVPKEYDLDKILEKNRFLNTKSKSLIFIERIKKADSKDVIFYSLAIIILLFAILKFLYPRYFSNLFRVFFNTSLRQSQLTDQLLQSKLPSLLYNIFFILIGGWYLYLLLNYFETSIGYSKFELLLICAGCLATVYLGKFCILKFTGWITGYKQEADTYIFIIFLINKIVAICLIPLVVIMAFSDHQLGKIALLLSFIVIALMVLMRFFRSYSLLQNRLKVSRLHFFIYIIGIEIIPILVIYRVALIFMSKNL